MSKVTYYSGPDSADESEIISFDERVEGGKQLTDLFNAQPSEVRLGMSARAGFKQPIEGAPKETEREGTVTVYVSDRFGRTAGRLVVALKRGAGVFVNPALANPDEPKTSPPSDLGADFIEAVKPMGFRFFQKGAAAQEDVAF
jgi:hypothetical protein